MHASYYSYSSVSLYHTADFICEVLICVNYVRCHKFADFNSTVTFNSASNCSTCVTVQWPCLVIRLTYICFKAQQARVPLDYSVVPLATRHNSKRMVVVAAYIMKTVQ